MSAGRIFVLITRPEAEAALYAKELREAGFSSLLAPMLDIQPIPFPAPDLAYYQALLFTSVNGVRAFCAQVEDRDICAYTVGQHTAQEAKKQGFTEIRSAAGTGVDMVRLVVEEAQGPARPFLHVRGDHAALALDEALATQGLRAERLVVYHALPVEVLTPEVLSALRAGEVQAVTFFSRRTAENFMEIVRRAGLEAVLKGIKALCISESVLQYVQPDLWLETYASGTPDRGGMMVLLQRACIKVDE
ncbi:MAG: uroporphyrinogen-III synthase [Alphaproteobacteria bacterium]|nr:uroporphyrinogen-III synthase [Alphaproteobacteria bacterium]